jgi:cytochrome o ubiquinol oxidase subunit IV
MIKKYTTGYLLALFLTCISFLLALIPDVTKQMAITGIIIAGVVQIVVHLTYFLHIDRSAEARWNLISLLFAIVLIAFFIGGTIWIMHTLNQRMM